MATSVMDVMTMGNIVPRIKPTSLAFLASVLTVTPHRLPDVTLCPCLSMQFLASEVSADYYTLS